MNFATPPSNRYSEGDLVSVQPPDSLGLLGVGASAGSSTLEATSAYDESWNYLTQMGLDPNYLTYEASTVDPNYLTYETPSHGTVGDFNIQSSTATGDQKNPAMDQKPRPICVLCNKDFGRVSECNRHVKETHGHGHQRQCPFCDFMWTVTRPHLIKAHAMANHAESFTAEMLDELVSLRGQRVIEFLDGHGQASS